MDTKQALTCTGHFATPKYYRYESLLLEVPIWINGAGFWRPSVSGLLTFRPNISPSTCFFSFANHLISNIRCDKDNSGMPMFISPMLRCTFVSFTRWALTSRPDSDKVFISHPAPTQPLHISTFAPTVNLGPSDQNNVFIEIVSSASLSIHLPLGGNFQVVSQEFHPNFFSLRFPPSFEIRLQTRNPNFSRMSD